jgi:hypothetical protein
VVGYAQGKSPDKGMLPEQGGAQHGTREDQDEASHLKDGHDSRVEPAELGTASGEIHDMELSETLAPAVPAGEAPAQCASPIP